MPIKHLVITKQSQSKAEVHLPIDVLRTRALNEFNELHKNVRVINIMEYIRTVEIKPSERRTTWFTAKAIDLIIYFEEDEEVKNFESEVEDFESDLETVRRVLNIKDDDRVIRAVWNGGRLSKVVWMPKGKR